MRIARLHLVCVLLMSCTLQLKGKKTPSVRQGSIHQIPEVTKSTQKVIEEKRFAGTIVLVWHKSKVIHLSLHGYSDVASQKKMSVDTIVRLYSMTKPITTVAAMMLYEEGKLHLDKPIDHYLPEFKDLSFYSPYKADPLKRKPTVRDLLRHTAGFTYGFFSKTAVDQLYMENHPLLSENNYVMVQSLARYPLLFQPGERWHYSMATDVVGHLIERISGLSLSRFMKERIFDPLGMVDTHFFVPQHKLARFSSSYGPKHKLIESFKGSAFLNPQRLQSGGGGLVSTVHDYLRFTLMLLNKGTHKGVRLLKKTTVDLMTSNQLPDGVLAYDVLGFGFGMYVNINEDGFRNRLSEFGWNGAASTHFWISPKDDLVVIVLSQKQPYDSRLKDVLLPLIYRSIQKKSR